MGTSLDKLENKVQIHDLHVKRFHMVKRLQKSVQYIWRYLTKYDSFFLAVWYLAFTYELWSYWTEFPGFNICKSNPKILSSIACISQTAIQINGLILAISTNAVGT